MPIRRITVIEEGKAKKLEESNNIQVSDQKPIQSAGVDQKGTQNIDKRNQDFIVFYQKGPQDDQERPQDGVNRPPEDQKSFQDGQNDPQEDQKSLQDSQKRPQDSQKSPKDEQARPQDSQKSPIDEQARPQDNQKSPKDEQARLQDSQKSPIDEQERLEEDKKAFQDEQARLEEDKKAFQDNQKSFQKSSQDGHKSARDNFEKHQDTYTRPSEDPKRPRDNLKSLQNDQKTIQDDPIRLQDQEKPRVISIFDQKHPQAGPKESPVQLKPSGAFVIFQKRNEGTFVNSEETPKEESTRKQNVRDEIEFERENFPNIDVGKRVSFSTTDDTEIVETEKSSRISEFRKPLASLDKKTKKTKFLPTFKVEQKKAPSIDFSKNQKSIEPIKNKNLSLIIEDQSSIDSGIGEKSGILSPFIMDSQSDAMSMITTDDEDTQSLIGVDASGSRVRKRSINYDNPEIMKAIKTAGRLGVRAHSDQPLTALSEVGPSPRTSSVPLLLFGKAANEQLGRNGTLAEEENEQNATPGSVVATSIDTIYEMFKNSETGKVSVRKFLTALTGSGIQTFDPRLDASMHNLKRTMKRYGADFDAANTLHLDENEFKEVIRPNAMTINRFLRTNFVVPEWSEFCRHIARLYELCRTNDHGHPSDFIPQLAAYDRKLWGVAVCSVDGQRFHLGDFNVTFCLQAVSRVLNYAIALNDLGAEKVHSYVGQEPSGRNAKELVLDENQKPHNPMINAGAIVITALLKQEEKHMADRFDAIDKMYKKMAGKNEFIGFCNQAYLSERQISFRNYALGYFLRENKCLPEPERLTETIELMLQLCAVEVSCQSLAVMAATLANGGVCPITEEYVIGSSCVRNALSLMYTTGMNDYSGQFAFHVGLPAKSSISGAIMLVIPNVMGIALWSPNLDSRSNSVRGLQFCTELVKVFNFHNYDNLRFTQRKLDPRKMQAENKAAQIVLTLFSAADGDLNALSRFYLQGIDLTMADYDRRTPLHVAAAEGHMHCVKFLVEKARVPCRPVDRWNNTPADDARYHNHPEIADYLEHWDMNRALAPIVPIPIPQNGPTSKMNQKSLVDSPSKSPDSYDASPSEEEYDSGEGSSFRGSELLATKFNMKKN